MPLIVSAGIPGPLSRDDDPGVVDLDRDRRRDAGLLAGVERVVDKLLDDHERPLAVLVSGLRRQLLDRREVEKARGREGRALKLLGGGHGFLVSVSGKELELRGRLRPVALGQAGVHGSAERDPWRRRLTCSRARTPVTWWKG